MIMKLMNALTALLFGSGILALVVGPCAGVYSLGKGIIGLIVMWVLALTLRVYLTTRDDEDLNYSRRQVRR